MCLGIPMQVVEAAGESAAWCTGRDGRVLIDMTLVGAQAPGTWLLTFVGAAREVMTPESAAQVAAALDALAALFAPKELQNVVSYATVIEVANPELMLRPGMTASIAIIAAHKKNILRVANAALRFKPDAEDKFFSKDQASSDNQAPAADSEIKKLYRLWIINQDGKIQTAEITTGIYDTRYTEIATCDVREGQAVIVGYQPQWRKSDAKGSFFRLGSRQ